MQTLRKICDHTPKRPAKAGLKCRKTDYTMIISTDPENVNSQSKTGTHTGPNSNHLFLAQLTRIINALSILLP